MKSTSSKILMIFGLTVSLGIGLTALFPQNVLAGEGSLHLDTNLITNSKGGVGSLGDFPIKGSLFTDEMNRKTQKQNDFNVHTQLKKINFSSEDKGHYNADFSKTTALLFSSYHPENTINDDSTVKRAYHFWYYILAFLLIPLVFISYWLGKMAAKKRLKKIHGTNHN